MKHRFPIPYADPALDARIADLGSWLWQWGWSIDSLSAERNYLHDPLTKYRVTMNGWQGVVPAKIEVYSGAVLVYDTEERSLGITDRQPREPEDEIPAQWRESEDAVPAGFVDRNADPYLIRDRSFDAAWWWPWPLGPKRAPR